MPTLNERHITENQHGNKISNEGLKHLPRPNHWRELCDPRSGKLVRCRPPGATAGSWPHTPWWHCVFHDRYERINFWSHAVPAGLLLIIMGLASSGIIAGGGALVVYCMCSCITHSLSALTHVYPDSHALEKCDHVGIVATIAGTPITALISKQHGHMPGNLQAISVALICSAFLPPVARVVAFVAGGLSFVILYGRQLISLVFIAELLLYAIGAAAFLRNRGHDRLCWMADHHFLHYFVTLAAMLHIYYLMSQC